MKKLIFAALIGATTMMTACTGATENTVSEAVISENIVSENEVEDSASSNEASADAESVSDNEAEKSDKVAEAAPEAAVEIDYDSLVPVYKESIKDGVYENVQVYRERMDAAGVKPEDIQSVDDLYKLPFTCKQDLRDNYPYGLFAVPMDKVVRVHASSGTTGKQIVVGYTKKDLDTWSECCARALTTPRMVALRA